MRLLTLLLMALMTISIGVQAKPVQIESQGLRLNADYQDGDRDEPIFVILHGTGMHHTSTLTMYLQDALAFEGRATLNVSLSLGFDNRESIFTCEQPVISPQQAAVDELSAWFDWLEHQGWDRFVLLAHSRGGAQSILFYQQTQQEGLEELVLLAPMAWQSEPVANRYQERFNQDLADQVERFRQMAPDERVRAPVLYCPSAEVSPDAFLSIYTPEPEKHTPTLIKDIDIPTTVYLGTQDDLSHRFAQYESTVADNPNVTVTWIEGADHFFRNLYSDEIIGDYLGTGW